MSRSMVMTMNRFHPPGAGLPPAAASRSRGAQIQRQVLSNKRGEFAGRMHVHPEIESVSVEPDCGFHVGDDVSNGCHGVYAREAALDVLAGQGFAEFTMKAVSGHSGISKSTLYRHWPDRIQLLADALETLNRQPRRTEPLQATDCANAWLNCSPTSHQSWPTRALPA